MGGVKLLSVFIILAIAISQSYGQGALEYKARISYEYLQEDGSKTKNEEQWPLVNIGDGILIGSAQLFCRHLNPPLEQV